MKTAIHNTNPGLRFVATNTGSGPSDAEWAALERQVADLRHQAASLKPEAIEAAVTAGLRPLAAELALREKELQKDAGMRVHKNAFLLPKSDGGVTAARSVANSGYKLPKAEA